jgi:hypothetical protein
MTTKNSDGQIDLFTEPHYVPEWLRRSQTEFDPVLAERFKREAMSAAASSPAHQELLNLLRPALIGIALSRSERTATADDASRWLAEHGYEPGALGNAAGSLFRGGNWKLVGYLPSERTSRHRNRVGVWQLLQSR